MGARAAALRGASDQNLRDHLIGAAERLIGLRGTAGLTVREIAREAGMATGVLYNHFADKEELLALGLHAFVRATEAALGEQPGPAGVGTVSDNLAAYITRGVALHLAIVPAFMGMFTQPALLSRFLALPHPAASEQALPAQLANYLRAEQALGRIRAAANVDAAVTMVIGACHEMALPQVYGGSHTARPEPAANFIADLTATIMNGIGPPA